MTTDRNSGGGAADGNTVDSIVGQGTRMSGQVDLTGMLRIDGEFHGEVRAGGRVLVGHTGRTECTLRAVTVVVAGSVRGDVVASDLVELRSTATVIGSICAPRLIVEGGGRFCGRCRVGGGDGRMTESRPASPYAAKPA